MNEGFLNWNPKTMPGQVPADVATPFAATM